MVGLTLGKTPLAAAILMLGAVWPPTSTADDTAPAETGQSSSGNWFDELEGAETTRSDDIGAEETTGVQEGAQDDSRLVDVISLPTPQPEPGEPEDEEPGAPQQLDEIVVTATKREASARELPISVDAFSADKMNEQGAEGMQDALLRSPGVSVNQYYTPSTVNIQMRGTTTNTVTLSGATPVGAFLDDIPLSNPSLLGANPNIDTFDLARVEILKGPQGTLFGGSALAGALRSIPNSPEFEQFSGQAFVSQMSISDSNGNSTSWGAMLNVPIGSSVALRAMVVRRDYPGTIDDMRNGVPDTDHSRAEQQRAIVAWDISESLSLQAMVHEMDIDLNDVLYADNPDTNSRSNEDGLSPVLTDHRFSQLRTKYEGDGFSLTGSAAKVEKSDLISLQLDRFFGGQTSAADTASVQDFSAESEAYEIRAASSLPYSSSWALFDKWSWMIGIFYFSSDQSAIAVLRSEDRSATGGVPPVGNADALAADVFAYAEEQALFVDVTRPLGDQFEVNFGARTFRQDFSGDSETTNNGVPVSSSSLSTSTDGINPKLALSWHVSDDVLMYTSAVKGFRFGGVNLLIEPDSNAPPFYESDELWNYELGLRSDLLGRNLRVDVTAFFIDWANVQVDQRTDLGLSPYIDNAGGAVSRGVESSIQALLPAGFMVRAAGAYIDARTTEPFVSNGGDIPEGRRLPGTPELTGSASLEYVQYLGSGQFTSSLTWTYQGSTFNDLLQSNEIPAYELLGLNVGFAMPYWTGSPALTLNIGNLLNKHAINNVLPPIQGVSDYFPIRPRSITLRLSAGF